MSFKKSLLIQQALSPQAGRSKAEAPWWRWPITSSPEPRPWNSEPRLQI